MNTLQKNIKDAIFKSGEPCNSAIKMCMRKIFLGRHTQKEIDLLERRRDEIPPSVYNAVLELV